MEPNTDRGPLKRNLYGFDAERLATLPELADQPPYRSRQIARWLYREECLRFEAMSNLSSPLRGRLADGYRIDRIEPVEERVAGDDRATKVRFALEDGGSIEAVWIRDRRRDTFCISSQAGCAYGCSFCATASMKAGRNLSVGEIVGQVAHLREARVRRATEAGARQATDVHPNREAEARLQRATDAGANREPLVHPNLVFMGMGEPLANYDSLIRALYLLCAEEGFGFPPRRITVSTVGLVPEIRRLAGEPLAVRIAFSINATTDAVRSKLMPVNRKYPFHEVLDALREFQSSKQRRVTLEYVLLRGVNDTPDDARRLAGFARKLDCRINLIAYNPHRFASYEPTSDEELDAFCRTIRDAARSVPIMVRRSKGGDIAAACGQLATEAHGV